MDDVEYHCHDGIAKIILNRPHRRNAVTLEMVDRLASLLSYAATDKDVRVVVLAGRGGAFCSGIDLDELTEHTRTALSTLQMLADHFHSVGRAIERLDKPLLASVDGAAVGAGMDMALMCDVRFASERSRFSQGYVKVGLIPGDGGCYLLPRLVGMAKALELMWTGDEVTAPDAHRLGIVDHLHQDAASMEDAVEEFARRLSSGPPLALQLIKRLSYESRQVSFRTALDLAAAHQAVIQTTHDSEEALRAFREKRSGVFTGS